MSRWITWYRLTPSSLAPSSMAFTPSSTVASRRATAAAPVAPTGWSSIWWQYPSDLAWFDPQATGSNSEAA